MYPETAYFRKCRNKVIAMILLLLPMCALAQKKGTEDVVHLKSHFGLTEVHGTLIPEKDSNEIAIRSWDKNVWVFSRSDIDSISREKLIFLSEPNGWYNTTSAALYFGEDKGYQIQSVVGYRFHYRYYAGLGAAIDNYTIRTLPVFADFRTDFSLHKNTPFAYVDIGLANPWPKKDQYAGYYYLGKSPDKKVPGCYLNIGIGQRLRSRQSHHSWEFSVGYSLETLKLVYFQKSVSPDPGAENIPTQTDTYQYTFNRLVLRVGVTL